MPPAAVGRFRGAVTTVTVTGLPLLNREVMQAVQDSGWQSVVATVVLSVLILTIFFFAAFRSSALGALTIAPHADCRRMDARGDGRPRLSLNMMTVMIATTTVGMGDLYAIHISYAYARALRPHKDPVAAAAHMMRRQSPTPRGVGHHRAWVPHPRLRAGSLGPAVRPNLRRLDRLCLPLLDRETSDFIGSGRAPPSRARGARTRTA